MKCPICGVEAERLHGEQLYGESAIPPFSSEKCDLGWHLSSAHDIEWDHCICGAGPFETMANQGKLLGRVDHILECEVFQEACQLLLISGGLHNALVKP